MLSTTIGAAIRALLVALLIALPSLILPETGGQIQIVPLITLVAAALTFSEYRAEYPSLVEFRFAPPINRIRFGIMFLMVLFLSMVHPAVDSGNPVAHGLRSIGMIVGHAVDFPYSPAQMMTLMLPATADAELVNAMIVATGIVFPIAVIGTAVFAWLALSRGWPTRTGAFNVWVNLPHFDPTSGGDVLHRMKRDATLNLSLGILMPFFVPAAIKVTALVMKPVNFSDPQTLIWIVSAWGLLPASMIMRGIAMTRVAALVEEQRRKVYSNAEALQPA